MVGVRIPHTPIIIDGFTHANRRRKAGLGGVAPVFFLSHMHEDHFRGLSPRWNGGVVYCSPVTRRLLLNRFGRGRRVTGEQ